MWGSQTLWSWLRHVYMTEIFFLCSLGDFRWRETVYAPYRDCRSWISFNQWQEKRQNQPDQWVAQKQKGKTTYFNFFCLCSNYEFYILMKLDTVALIHQNCDLKPVGKVTCKDM